MDRDEFHALLVDTVPIRFGPYTTADRIVETLQHGRDLDGVDLEILIAALDRLTDTERLNVARTFVPFRSPDGFAVDLAFAGSDGVE